MSDTDIELSREERELVSTYLWFYEELDKAKRRPSNDAQKHFVEVCRCTTTPVTPHEVAYTKYRMELAREQRVLKGLESSSTPEIEDGHPNRLWGNVRFEPSSERSFPKNLVLPPDL